MRTRKARPAAVGDVIKELKGVGSGARGAAMRAMSCPPLLESSSLSKENAGGSTPTASIN
jgi:hypothetical protein